MPFAADATCTGCKDFRGMRPVVVAYVLFIIFAWAIYDFVADRAFSAILTLSVMVQCLGISLLCIQLLSSGSASGISAGSLILDAVAFGCRLSSTTWLNGYLPVDASGDYVYQAVDVCSLLMVVWLLRRVLVVQRSTYQAAEDSLCISPMVLGSLVLASLLHADMDDHPIFDTLWMTGLFVGVVAVLPQLWLIMKAGGQVDALASHYVAALAVSRVLSGIFMWNARADIICTHWIDGFNHASFVIMAAHVVHLLLMGDFAYYYACGLARRGFHQPVDMTGANWV